MLCIITCAYKRPENEWAKVFRRREIWGFESYKMECEGPADLIGEEPLGFGRQLPDEALRERGEKQ